MLETSLRSWAIGFSLVLLFALYDLGDRNFNGEQAISDRANDLPHSAFSGNLNDKNLDDILTLYDGFDKPVEPVAAVTPVAEVPAYKGLSESERNNQSGQLENFYTKDYKYTVVGLFEEQAWFAVLEEEHVVTGAKKELRVDIGGMLPPYQISRITSASVELISTINKNVIQLTIF